MEVTQVLARGRTADNYVQEAKEDANAIRPHEQVATSPEMTIQYQSFEKS